MQVQSDWTHSFKRSFKSASDLYHFLNWEMPHDVKKVCDTFPLFVPERLANKIKIHGPNSALAKQFIPHELEIDSNLKGLEDPIGDKAHQKAPQLIHRYPSRALFTPTTICPVHCRYCFRKNELYSGDELFQNEFEGTLHYLRKHPEISEVIFTGGDPLTLSNTRIENYFASFAQIKHIRHIRLHTRWPVILPERIDTDLVQLLQKYSQDFQTVSVAIHANLIEEFDTEVEEAIKFLRQSSVQLLSQTVLLKGINDSPENLQQLIEKFLSLNVRPYYLHHPDRVKGGMHFYLPLEEGRKIYGKLRQLLPGWAIPQYVIDVPGGYGKVPAFNPESNSFSGQILTLYGQTVEIQEPDFFV